MQNNPIEEKINELEKQIRQLKLKQILNEITETFRTSKNETDLNKFDGAINIVALNTNEIIAVNNIFLAKTGFTREQIIGKKTTDLNIWTENSRNAFRKILQEKGECIEFITVFNRPNQEPIQVNISAKIFMFNNAPHILTYTLGYKTHEYAHTNYKESALKLERLIRNVQGIVYRTKNNADRTIEFISYGCYELTGYHPNDFISGRKRYIDIVHVDDRKIISNTLNNSLQEKQSYQLTYRIITFKNEERWVSDIGVGVNSPTGEIIALEGVIYDITQQKRNEILIKQNEEKFINAFMESPVGLVISRISDGTIIEVNQRILDFFKLNRTDLVNKTSDSIPFWKDREKRNTYLNIIKKEGIARNFEMEYTYNNQTYYFSLTGRFIEINGEQCLFTSFTNITEQIKSKNELIEQKELFFTLAEHSPNMIFINQNNRIVYANKMCSDVMGYSREEFYSETFNFIKLIDPDFHSLIKEKYIAHNNGIDLPPYEYRIITKNGKKLDVINSTKIINYKSNKAILGVITDISEQKQLERKLIESELTFRILAHTATAVIFMHKGKNFIFTNQSMHKSTGYSNEELLTMNFWEIIHPDYREIVKQRGIAQLKGESPINRYEIKILTKQGEVRWMELSATQITINNEATVIGTGFDITDRKRAEQSLAESEERFRKVTASAHDAIIILNSERQVTYWNEAATYILGYTFEEMQGKDLHDFVIPKDYFDKYTEIVQNFKKNDSRKFGNTMELSAIRKDGNEIPVEISINSFTVNNETYTVGILRDITNRKKIELQLQANEEKLRKIIESSPDGIIVLNNKSQIIDCNSKALNFLGVSDKEIMLTLNPYNFLASSISKEILDETIVALKENKFLKNREYNLKRIDGNEFSVEISASIIDSAIEDQQLIVVTFKDISERKLYEKTLIAAKEKAEEADRLKSAFLSNMSHEIRTPMNAIIGFADLLIDHNLSDSQRKEYVSIINSSGKLLLNIIEDIIDIAKIEAGQMRLFNSQFDVVELVQKIIRFYSEDLNRKNKHDLKINFNNNPKEKIIIVSDNLKLHQILSNLINNAIKYTSKGTIEVGIIKRENNILQFYVKDTGIGIPKEKFSIIFERFRQVDETNVKKYGGTGLGLAICKSMVELLGGTMWLESYEGYGSIFYFTIFYTKPKQLVETIINKKINKKPISLKNKTILVVEDDINSNSFIEEVLNKTKAKLIYTHNAIEAIKICNTIKMIDLILMDIHLPGMNGLEATKEIIKINPKIPIIAQTAFALSDERSKCLEIGCIDYISKPYIASELIAVITKHI